MAADIAAYGIGAVDSQVMPGGGGKSVAFASRTLTSSERNYAPIGKESLGKQAVQHDQHAGQVVRVHHLRSGDNWIPGVVLKQLGPVSYLVDVGEGRAWKRHIDHLKVRDLPEPDNSELTPQVEAEPDLSLPTPDTADIPGAVMPAIGNPPGVGTETATLAIPPIGSSAPSSGVRHCYPSRHHQPLRSFVDIHLVFVVHRTACSDTCVTVRCIHVIAFMLVREECGIANHCYVS